MYITVEELSLLALLILMHHYQAQSYTAKYNYLLNSIHSSNKGYDPSRETVCLQLIIQPLYNQQTTHPLNDKQNV